MDGKLSRRKQVLGLTRARNRGTYAEHIKGAGQFGIAPLDGLKDVIPFQVPLDERTVYLFLHKSVDTGK